MKLVWYKGEIEKDPRSSEFTTRDTKAYTCLFDSVLVIFLCLRLPFMSFSMLYLKVPCPFALITVMVNSLCQLDWSLAQVVGAQTFGCSDTWLNIISKCVCGVFWDEIVWIGRLITADCPPQCGLAALHRLRATWSKKSMWENVFFLLDWVKNLMWFLMILIFYRRWLMDYVKLDWLFVLSCFWTWTQTGIHNIDSPSYQAFGFRTELYTTLPSLGLQLPVADSGTSQAP